ncbi:MAG: hypothetical protein E7589_00170 [Ruminococcaceae bacterium]|nr:hypothetical protein [Oscillospiraceae bacterium]
MKRITTLLALLALVLCVSMSACSLGSGDSTTEAATTTEATTTTAAATESSTTAETTAQTTAEQTTEAETFAADSHWNSATYTKDTQLGEGKNQIKVIVKTEDYQITLTVNTDKDNLGEALFELGLINDASFFDTVNGMKLDWNTEKAYWGFYKNGDYMMVGADEAPVEGVEQYELVYTKG